MLFCIIVCLIASTSAAIVNIEVNRSINITTQTAREETTITFTNGGNAPVSTYYFLVSPEVQVSFLEFTSSTNRKLNYRENLKGKNGFTVYLDKIVKANDSYDFTARISSVGDTKSRYKQLQFTGANNVFDYKGNVYFYSAYKTLKLKVSYLCKAAANNFASILPHLQDRDYLHYYYVNVVPYSKKKVQISFQSTTPFFVVTTLNRTIDVSHWGRIFIEDRICLEAIGYRLKGPYEAPYELSRPWHYTHLPASAEDIKLFDELGIMYQSKITYANDYITFRHKTRYPLLFGGWKAPYVLQYTVPTYEYLQEKGGIFYLSIRAIDHIVNDAFVENAFVNILLPNGAIIKKIKAPKWFNVSKDSDFNDLTFSGRKTAQLHGRMLVEDQIEDVKVVYEFSNLWLLRTPILLTGYVLIVLIFLRSVNYVK